jgi:two-component system, chemotaxis family, chemotaxis protein CheY
MEINALVIDDSGIMRKMVMRSLLESKLAEFTFVEAKDGVEGLSQFNSQSVGMIFVDWNMPNMSGIEFVREVRKSNTTVPIVMITTESTMDKVEEALDQSGVDCFIVKPFTTEILQKKLAPLFEKLSAPPQKSGGFFSRLAAKVA